MFFGERAANFRQRGGNLVGFGRQNQDAGEFRDFGVGRDRFRADFGGEMFSRGVHRVAGDDFAGADEFAADEAAGERGGHFARAEKADFQWGCHESFVAGHLVERKKITPVNSRLEFAPLALILGAGTEKSPSLCFTPCQTTAAPGTLLKPCARPPKKATRRRNAISACAFKTARAWRRIIRRR